MAKINLNPYRNSLSTAGLVSALDVMVGQPLRKDSSVTFRDITVTEDLVIEGNTTMKGDVTVISTDVLKIQDAVIELNDSNENPLLEGGIQVNRGPGLTPYQFVYEEKSGTFRVGAAGDLQPVATREDDPLPGGITVWSPTKNQFVSRDTVDIPVTFQRGARIRGDAAFGNSDLPPTISGSSSGDLLLDVPPGSNILLGDAADTGSVVIPASRTLAIGDVQLLQDTSGGLAMSGNGVAFQSASAVICWPGVPRHAEVGSPTPGQLALRGAVPLVFGTVTDMTQTDGGRFLIRSNAVLEMSAPTVLVPNLSVANNGALKPAENGALSVESHGNLILDPYLDVIVNDGVSLLFGSAVRSIRDDMGNLVLENKHGDVELRSDRVVMERGTDLVMGASALIKEDLDGKLVFNNESSAIYLNAAAGALLPANAPLKFGGDTEAISGNGVDVAIDASRFVLMNATMRMNTGKSIQFGSSLHSVGLTSSGDLKLLSRSQIVLDASTVQVPSVTFTDGSSIRPTSGGNLVVQLSSQGGSVILPRVNAQTLSTREGATFGGNVGISGNTELLGNVVFRSDAAISGSLTSAHVAMSGRPDGRLMTFLSSWDGNASYGLSRSLPRDSGGRQLLLTIPSFAEYGNVGTEPSFAIGRTARDNLFFVVTGSRVNLPTVGLTISSPVNGDASLDVKGASKMTSLRTEDISTTQLAVAGDLTVEGRVVAGSGAAEITDTNVIVNAPLVSKTSFVTEGSTHLSGSVRLGTNLDAGGNRIVNLPMPTQPDHACSKAYADLIRQNLSVKQNAVAASTENIRLDLPLDTLDNVPMFHGARVLLMNQDEVKANGLYTIDENLVPRRATDLLDDSPFLGSLVFVTRGYKWGGTSFIASTVDPLLQTAATGRDPMMWTPFSGASSVQSGKGLMKTGNILEVKTDGRGIVATELGISLATPGPGLALDTGRIYTLPAQSHVTGLGTITSGKWESVPVGTLFGGTGRRGIAEGLIPFGGIANGPLQTHETVSLKRLSNSPEEFGLTVGKRGPISSLVHIASEISDARMTVQGVGSSILTLITPGGSGEVSVTPEGITTLSSEKRVDVSVGTNDTLSVSEAGMLVSGTVHVRDMASLEDDLLVSGVIKAGSQGITCAESPLRLSGMGGVEIAGISQLGGDVILLADTTYRGRRTVNYDEAIHFRGAQGDAMVMLAEGPIVAKCGFGDPAAPTWTPEYVMSVSSDGSLLLEGREAGSNLDLGQSSLRVEERISMGNSGSGTFSLVKAGMGLTIAADGDEGVLYLGGNGSSTSTVMRDATGSRFVRFDSGETSTEFRLSRNVPLVLEDVAHLGKGWRGPSSSLSSTFSQEGWFYLGPLREGVTVIEAPGRFLLRITCNDGIRYSTDLRMERRNDASIDIYLDDLGFPHLFARVITAPFPIEVHQAPEDLRVDRWEGVAAVPSGGASSFDPATWRLDYATDQATASGHLAVGKFSASGASELSSVSVNGPASVAGEFRVDSNASFQGEELQWISALGNSISMGSGLEGPELIMESFAPGGNTRIQLGQDAVISASEDRFRVVSETFSVSTVDGYEGLTVSRSGTQLGGDVVVQGSAAISHTVTAGLIEAPAMKIGTRRLSDIGGGAISFHGSRLSNIATPIADNDCATKVYCDMLVKGGMRSVTLASTGNVDLGTATVVLDGVLVYPGYIVLLKDQTDPAENGLYEAVGDYLLVRSSALDDGTPASGMTVWVAQGEVNASCAWMCTSSPGSDIAGTDPLIFVQVSNPNDIQAGNGLRKIGKRVDVLVDGRTLEISSDVLRVSAGVAGLGLAGGANEPLRVADITHLSALGTITSGRWQAEPVSLEHGGTGSATFPPFAVPVSSGTRLIPSRLYFDTTNARLGINSSTPTHGLTVQDRDILLSQTGATAPAMLFSGANEGTMFGWRKSAGRLVLSYGMGIDKAALQDVMTIDSTGSLISNGQVSAGNVIIGGTVLTGTSMYRTVDGPTVQNIFSLNNAGCTTVWYGGLGNHLNNGNSEFMRAGFFNGRFVLQTSRTGSGISRDLCLQSGLNTNQLVLRSDGSVNVSGSLQVMGGFAAPSITCQAFVTETAACTEVKTDRIKLGPVWLYNSQEGIVTDRQDGEPMSFTLSGGNASFRLSPGGDREFSVQERDGAFQLHAHGGDFIIETGLGVPEERVRVTEAGDMALRGSLHANRVEAASLSTLQGADISGDLTVTGRSSFTKGASVSGPLILEDDAGPEVAHLRCAEGFLSVSETRNGVRLHGLGGPLDLGGTSTGGHYLRVPQNGRLNFIVGPGTESTSQMQLTDEGLLLQRAMRVTADISARGSLTVDGTVSCGKFTIGDLSLEKAPNAVNMRVPSRFSVQEPSGQTILRMKADDRVLQVLSSLEVTTQSKVALLVTSEQSGELLRIDAESRLLDLNGCRISNAGAPLRPTDLVTREYVDRQRTGLNFKRAALCSSYQGQAVDITRPVYELDGIYITPGDRVLLMDQTTNAVENGMYNVSAGNMLVRADDLPTGSHAQAAFCFVSSGITRGGTAWVCTAQTPFDVVGSHSLEFTQFGGTTFDLGRGLQFTNENILEVRLDANSGLFFNGDALRIDPRLAGKNLLYSEGQIVLSPVIVDTVWNGDTVSVPYGGTGNTQFAPLSMVMAGADGLILESADNVSVNDDTLLVNRSAPGGDALRVKGGAVTLQRADLTGMISLNPESMDSPGAMELIFQQETSQTVLRVTENGSLTLNFEPGIVTDEAFAVNGDVLLTGSLKLGDPLSVSSGGSGRTTFLPGVIYSQGGSGPLHSTGLLGDGGVVIGGKDGDVRVEYGAVLRDHLGLAIGRDVNAWSPTLDNLASLSFAANAFIVGTGDAFTSLSGQSARNAMGLGRLATYDVVDDLVFSGKELSVKNGGTGSTMFEMFSLPFFDGTKLASSDVFFDADRSGLGIGIDRVASGNGLQVFAKDVSVQVHAGSRPGFSWQTASGAFSWRLTTDADDKFILTNGLATREDLKEVFSVANTTGDVFILSGTQAEAEGDEAALTVAGGMRVFGASTIGSGQELSLTIRGGISVSLDAALGRDIRWVAGKTIYASTDNEDDVDDRLLTTSSEKVVLHVPGSRDEDGVNATLEMDNQGKVTLGGTDNFHDGLESGALTVCGAVHNRGETVVGGNLVVSGDLMFTDDGRNAHVSFEDVENAITAVTKRSRLKHCWDGFALSACLLVTPIDPNEWTYVTFDAPERSRPFSASTDVLTTVSALTASPRPLPAVGCVCSAVAGTKQIVVGVRMSSPEAHEVQVQLQYAC